MQDHITLLPQVVFGEKLFDFKERYGLSYVNLSSIFGNIQYSSSKTLYKIVHGKASHKIYSSVVPRMKPYFEAYLRKEDLDEEEIQAELEELGYGEKEMIINRCELTSAAVKFFGLTQDPFDVDRIPSDEELYSNDELDETARRVCDAVLYKRFLALVSPIGSGKTAMKIRVARELADAKQEVRLIFPEFFDMRDLSVGGIASYILQDLEVPVPQSSPARVRKIKEILTSMEKDDIRTALVFDECHRLNKNVLVSLKNFWEMTNGGFSRLLGIILFGQPTFVQSTLRDVQFREIAERVQVLELPPFRKTSRDFLAHKLRASGANIDELFDRDSVKRICANALTPLALGNLTNAALMEAFRLEEKKVVSSMLDLPDQPKSLRAA